MKLINIKGNTYYIKGGTNTGVYIFQDKRVLLVDPGLGGMRPKKILSLLKENDLNLSYIINTHEHSDHYEGCSQLKQLKNDIEIYSSKYAKIFIENPDLFADYVMGGRGNNFLKSKIVEQENNIINIDYTINDGSFVLNKQKFEILSLSGHSKGSIGILTKDKVLFVGDLFIDSHILDKFNLLLMNDVKKYFESIQKIKEIDFEYMIIGHGKQIISKDDVNSMIESHTIAIHKYINQVKQLIEDKITIDNILKNIINNNNLTCNYKEYYFFRSSIVSIISYLVDLNKIDYEIKDGEVLYYSKK